MSSTLDIERAWLAQMTQAVLMGVAMMDKDGRCVQHFAHDPALRDLLIDYQKEKIRQLELDERLIENQAKPVTYSLPDAVFQTSEV